MRNRSVIFESVLDDIEASKESVVDRISKDALPERPYSHDYVFQKECYESGCDCLLGILLDMSEYTDEEIVNICADVREKFELVINRRIIEHSPIYVGVRLGEYNNKSTDIIFKAGLGIGCCIEGTGIAIRGNYTVSFCVGLKIDVSHIERFIDLLANTYGLMKSLRRPLSNNTGLQTGLVDVLCLRSVKYEYTRQYIKTDYVDGDSFEYAILRLYDLKYYGTSFKNWLSFDKLMLQVLNMRHPEINMSILGDSVITWMQKYSKVHRPSKYTRTHT